MKSIKFHPKALAFIRDQSAAIKQDIGEALRDVQKGINLGLPLSRPMPDVAPGSHELRVKDEATAVRVFYFVKLDEAIVVFHGFRKTTHWKRDQLPPGRQAIMTYHHQMRHTRWAGNSYSRLRGRDIVATM